MLCVVDVVYISGLCDVVCVVRGGVWCVFVGGVSVWCVVVCVWWYVHVCVVHVYLCGCVCGVWWCVWCMYICM